MDFMYAGQCIRVYLVSCPPRALVYCPHIYTPVVAPKTVNCLVLIILLHHIYTPVVAPKTVNLCFSFLILIPVLLTSGIRATVVVCDIQSEIDRVFVGVPYAASCDPPLYPAL
jgi:hypothetical protein